MAGTKTPRADILKLLLTSASSRVNLSILSVGMVLSVILIITEIAGTSVGIAVLLFSLLAYCALVGLDVFNPKFIREVHGVGEPDKKIEASTQIDPEQLKVQELKIIYESILNKHNQSQQAFKSTSELLKDNLVDSMSRCSELVMEAGRIAVKGDSLREYLNTQDPHSIEKQTKDLAAKARRTSDEKASEGFHQAVTVKRQQLETINQIEGLYDRINAQLNVIESSLDTIHAKIVKLKATDIEEAILVGQSIMERVDTLATDINLLESTVEETLQEFSI